MASDIKHITDVGVILRRVVLIFEWLVWPFLVQRMVYLWISRLFEAEMSHVDRRQVWGRYRTYDQECDRETLKSRKDSPQPTRQENVSNSTTVDSKVQSHTDSCYLESKHTFSRLWREFGYIHRTRLDLLTYQGKELCWWVWSSNGSHTVTAVKWRVRGAPLFGGNNQLLYSKITGLLPPPRSDDRRRQGAEYRHCLMPFHQLKNLLLLWGREVWGLKINGRERHAKKGLTSTISLTTL